MPHDHHKPNKGALFDNPSDNPRAPVKTGDLFIDGEVLKAAQRGERIRLAAWEAESKGGLAYLSLRASVMRDERQKTASRPDDREEREREEWKRDYAKASQGDIPF